MKHRVPRNLRDDDRAPDRAMTAGELERAALPTAEDLVAIDAALLQGCGEHWRKVAALVGDALDARESMAPKLPDVYYAQRVRHLVEMGVLESRGNLARMRYSEVRPAAGQGPGDRVVSGGGVDESVGRRSGRGLARNRGLP